MKLSIVIEYSILCDKCGHRDTTLLSGAKRLFKKQGWITIKKGTFCPNCSLHIKVI